MREKADPHAFAQRKKKLSLLNRASAGGVGAAGTTTVIRVGGRGTSVLSQNVILAQILFFVPLLVIFIILLRLLYSGSIEFLLSP